MLFVVIAILAGYLLIPIEQPRISQKNCDKIQKGWSPDQVEELLGARSIPFTRSVILEDADGMIRNTSVRLWIDDDGNAIEVVFEDGLEVTAKRYVASEHSFVERVKRRIERRIKALWP